MSKELRICPGVGARKCGAFLARLDRDPHPTCARCRGRICTKDMTCDFCAVWSAEQWELFGKKRSYKERKHRPSGSAPSAQQTSPRAETSLGVSRPGTSSSSSSRPLGGQGKREGSQGAPGVVLGGAPSPPARPRSSERGGSASGHSSGVGGLAPSSPSPSGGGGAGVARSRQMSLSRVSESVDSPNSHRTFHDVRIRGSLQPLAPALYPPAIHALRGVNRGRIRGLGLERVALVDVAVDPALAPLPVRGQVGVSVGGGHRPRHALLVVAHAVSGLGLLTATALGVEALGRVVTGLDPRIDAGHAVTALDVSGRGLLTATAPIVSVRVPLPVGGSGAIVRDRTLPRIARMNARGQARDYLLLLPACGLTKRDDWPDEEPRRVRRRLPPVAPGAAADVTPVAGGASMTALPSAMRELARFFMNLSGSSSLGATGDIAGVTASAVASGGLACPSSTVAGAATFCAAAATPAGAGVSPDAPAAVPGVSGEQQRRVRSRSRGRRSRSSSERTDRRAKKHTRRRSPSPGRSSRRREKRYRSSSDSSEDDRADASPPQARRAHGGARAGGSAWDFDCSWSSARVEPDRSGARRRSPGPSGVADNDRSSTFESVDFARDDSFQAVLGLIREFHDMAEPATVPAARCKTSLASAYGLASDSSPAFTLPVSPLLSTLLLDINSDLSKFLEDQTVHGFLPVPGRRQRRYYGTSTSSFPGPYTVPPGMTSITMEKASEVRKRSVSLSASQVSSMETMLSGMCEVASWLDWWLSTCGGYRDHLPIEVRADFERLMTSGSRALEFLASQGCTTLGNLVLARRDALLADVRSTVPAEEIARLRYSPLPQSAAIFPHALLDSALLKMRATASDALVQRTLHPPRIPRKPAAAGQSSGSSTACSGQASTSGASQAQKQ